MSYGGPIVIKEPDLRWPIYLVAAIITTLFVLLLMGVLHLSVRQPYSRSFNEPRLERAIRPGAAEFEQLREQLVVEQLVATEAQRPFNNMAVEMNATVRNTTGRTISGLNAGRFGDAQSLGTESTVGSFRAADCAEPDEGSRYICGGNQSDQTRRLMMEVTGLSIDLEFYRDKGDSK